MSGSDDLALEHAWRYFELHAAQRTTVFNFFAASASLTLSALAYVLTNSSAPGEFGVAAGVGAVLLAVVFWKLDQRVAQLTKCSEQIIVELEGRMFDVKAQTFAQADGLPVNDFRSPFAGTWSYGRSFRVLFTGVAVLGLVGVSLNGYRLLTREPEKHAQQTGGRPGSVAAPSPGSTVGNAAHPPGKPPAEERPLGNKADSE